VGECVECSAALIYATEENPELAANFNSTLCRAEAAQRRLPLMVAALKQPPSQHTGIYNLGNTCWANSVLQTLASTSLLRRLFTALPPPASSLVLESLLSDSSTPELSPPLASALRSVLISLWSKSDKPVKAGSLLTQWSRRCEGWVVGEQQDAHEGLTALLDGMTMEELDVCVIGSLLRLRLAHSSGPLTKSRYSSSDKSGKRHQGGRSADAVVFVRINCSSVRITILVCVLLCIFLS
jgi:hypothetical protein